MNAYLQALANEPLDSHARINKIWLPEGRKSAPRAVKIKTEPAPGDLTPKQVREKREAEDRAKMRAVLDYYATTTVPFERVSEHTGIPLDRLAECMKERGRLA